MIKTAHVFGPVPSRRLGLSLGVDVIPRKICSLNCIYCEVGRTTHLTLSRAEYLPAREILPEILTAFDSERTFDVVTFSGSGEPTLNSALGEITRSVKRLAKVPTAVITNGTLMHLPEVRRDLCEADYVLPSLDAATGESFQRVNRPHGRLDLPSMIDGLVQFRKEYKGIIWLEILLVKGVNDSPDELAALVNAVERIEPDKVHLNTVVRPPAELDSEPLSSEELELIRNHFDERCEVLSSFQGAPQQHRSEQLEAEIVSIIARRPLTLADIATSLGNDQQEIVAALDSLKSRTLIQEMDHDGRIFFTV